MWFHNEQRYLNSDARLSKHREKNGDVKKKQGTQAGCGVAMPCGGDASLIALNDRGSAQSSSRIKLYGMIRRDMAAGDGLGRVRFGGFDSVDDRVHIVRNAFRFLGETVRSGYSLGLVEKLGACPVRPWIQRQILVSEVRGAKCEFFVQAFRSIRSRINVQLTIP